MQFKSCHVGLIVQWHCNPVPCLFQFPVHSVRANIVHVVTVHWIIDKYDEIQPNDHFITSAVCLWSTVHKHFLCLHSGLIEFHLLHEHRYPSQLKLRGSKLITTTMDKWPIITLSADSRGILHPHYLLRNTVINRVEYRYISRSIGVSRE